MHACEMPASVRVTGPLVPFAGGLVAEFESLGYASSSAVVQMQLVAHLSRWLAVRGLGAADLTGSVIDSFLVDRRAGFVNLYSAQALAPALRYLREVGAVPAEQPAPFGGPVDALLASFGEDLRVRRGASAPVVVAYRRYVAPFAAGLVGADGRLDLAGLDASMVGRFLAGVMPGLSAKGAQMTACALRCFLRFAYARGLVTVDLSPAVPAVASRRPGVPRALSREQVGLLLASCDRSTRVGLRDYAVIVCLARLGLRAGEVGALALSDVDWVAGVLTVRGKGGRVDQLPLPVDVGQAVVSYLREGRPTTPASTVFVTAQAPFGPLGSSSVSCIVGRAARRAGLGTIHAHRLRHTAATTTLNAGASLEEVSLLLRHASPVTTVVYARSDLTRLAGIARPWPTGSAR